MRKYSRIVLVVLYITILIGLIIYSETAIKGAKDGIHLCIEKIIPSIFPFIFITMLVCNDSGAFSIKWLNPICRMTGIPMHTQQILILALVGGYPIGAQAVVKAYKDAQISRQSAKRLLAFCNNAGPSFIFGLVSNLFRNNRAAVCLWLIHICSALLVGILLPRPGEMVHATTRGYPNKITDVLRNSIRAMSVICGWVIIFRILIMLFECIIKKLPSVVQTVVCGLMELSNGCIMSESINNEYIRFIIISALLSFGGLCVLLQTFSVADDIGLGLYVPGKILQLLFSLSFSCLIGSFLYKRPLEVLVFIISLMLSTGIVLLLRKKSSRFILVNTV